MFDNRRILPINPNYFQSQKFDRLLNVLPKRLSPKFRVELVAMDPIHLVYQLTSHFNGQQYNDYRIAKQEFFLEASLLPQIPAS